MYLLRVPKILRNQAPDGLWEMPPGIQLSVYLTFDDGPHPSVTPFILDQLKSFGAKATFFCLGKNVVQNPEIYQRILQEDHAVGNHTFNHVNGWKTNLGDYVKDVLAAKEVISSNLFRPPYGRIRKKQAKALNEQGFQVVYWSLLSADFDQEISPQKCLKNIADHIQPGDIVLFHDSEKARDRVEFALPKVLELCKRKGWLMKALS